MLDWLNIHVDGLSFVLGLAAGTLFWVLWGQFKNYLPQIQNSLKHAIHEFQERNFAGVEVAIRQEALKQAQHAHLAARLFPLDEVIVQPKFIAPPPAVEPSQEPQNNETIPSIFPYLLDWPELPSQFAVDFISLAEALQKNANLVLVGRAGTGKTVALAHLASLMARKDPLLGVIQNHIPVFIHIQDLLTQSTLETGGPAGELIRHITARLPILDQNRAPSFLKTAFSEGRTVLLIDGLDELPPGELKAAVDLNRNLLSEYPRLQIVTTASPSYLDGLIELGFIPLSLACWSRPEIAGFIDHWTQSWNDLIAPEIEKKTGAEILDPVFIKNWIRSDQIHLTPLEWTLMLWAACSGEGGDCSPIGAVETFINRIVPDQALIQPVQKLALEMVKTQKTSFNQNVLDELLSRVSLSQVQLFDPSETPVEARPVKTTEKTTKDSSSLPGQWVAILVQTGLITEHPGHVLRFCHPVATAFLAAAQCPSQEIQEWLAALDTWEVRQLVLSYFCAKYPAQLTLPPEWLQGIAPLYRLPLLSGRLLKFSPTVHPVRTRILKRMAEGLMDNSALFATRTRFASALVCANDPSTITLFRQLLNAPSAGARQVACLAVGALRDTKSIDPLTTLLSDPDSEVRRMACYSMGALQDKTAHEILAECLTADDEVVREASAEVLAGDPFEGHAILKEAANSENLLARRSIVFGLTRIKENWAKELLEQIAVQDGQWVVRNAASQALDSLQKPDLRIPRPLTPPSETPWLFAYASKMGEGIPAGDPALNIILHALQSGTPEEQVAALEYLRTITDEIIIHEIVELAAQGSHPVDDAAQLTLWYIESTRAEQVKLARISFN